MKLLQINTVLNWGSTGRIAEEIGQQVIMEGGESYIAYSRGGHISKSHLIHIGNKLDMYMHGILTRLFDKHGLASKRATQKLIMTIDKIQPDIIHLHNIHGYYLNYPLLFSYFKKSEIPVVWTLHDCWSFTGHCSYFSFIGCNKWKTQCSDCPRLKTYPSSLLFDRSKRNFQDKRNSFLQLDNLTLVPVSQWLRNLLKDSFFANVSMKVIYNGIDTAIFSPRLDNKRLRRKCGISEMQFVVLGVASVWDERKGFNDFLKLRTLLPQDYTIILVGVNETQKKKIPNGVIGIMRTNSVEELADYYSMADVFFNPTWEDNFPTTNLEAMSCGTPVITYCTGGSIEAVDERTGFIVEQGDLEEVKEIIFLIRNQGKDKYAKECRQRAVALYNKKERYREYIDLYRNILINNNVLKCK